jgi:hypothetical protein
MEAECGMKLAPNYSTLGKNQIIWKNFESQVGQPQLLMHIFCNLLTWKNYMVLSEVTLA